MDNWARGLFHSARNYFGVVDLAPPIAFHSGGFDNAGVVVINDRRYPRMRCAAATGRVNA
jgi:hypothetical protein